MHESIAQNPIAGKPQDTAGWQRLEWSKVAARVSDVMSSIKLAMSLFILLAILATIGTVIQQNEQPEFYITEYGERAYWWFTTLGFTDVYHQWWFTGVLGILIANSLTCFHRRFPAIWRSMRRDQIGVPASFITAQKYNAGISVNTDCDRATEGLIDILGSKGYRVSMMRNDGGVAIFATKGIMGRVGAHVAHLSAAVIVAGGLIGGIWGFRDFGIGLPGETYFVPQGDFSLKVDDFWMDYYPNGAVQSYNSTLTVIDQGRETLTKTISVNDPLVYKGIWFYQSSYGDAWDRIERARVLVKDKGTDRILSDVMLDWKKPQVVDDLGITLAVTGFAADFAFDGATKTVSSKTSEHKNPAVQLEIREGGRTVNPWLFVDFPGIIDIPNSKYQFEIAGYLPQKYTGLQIGHNPGITLVWTGSLAIVVGMALSSFIFHRRLWARIQPDGARSMMHIGGNTHKGQIDFKNEFARLTEHIERIV